MSETIPPSKSNRPRHGRIHIAKREAIFLLLLVASMFGLYRHTLKYDLIWDTNNFAETSLLLQKNRPLADAFRYGLIQGQFGENKNSFYYRPIMNLSMMVENKLWGFHGTGIRLVNIAIFSLALVFLFIFFRLQAVFEDFAFLCTALFAFLPLNADNVIWGVARCDLFLLLWGLLTLIFFHLHLQKKSKFSYFLALVFFALGIFSKETFVFFIPVLAVYEWAETRRLSWPRHSAFVLIAATFFIVKHWLLQLSTLGSQPLPSLAENIRLLFSTLGYYVRVLLYPLRFPKYAFNSEIMQAPYFLLGIGSFLAITAYLFITRFKKNVIPLALIVFFLIPFVWLAFSKLWPFKISARYMMIPAIGIIWLLVMSLGKLKLYLRYLVCLALIALFLPFLLQSSFTYRDEVTYWAEGYNAHPHNGVAILMLARAHYDADNKIAAYHYLKESWGQSVDALTARHISILSSSLEYLRCDYPAALSWLDQDHAGSTYDACRLRASIQLARGNMAAAERILLQLMRQYPEKRLAYQLLFNVYIGREKWDAAAALEEKINAMFFLDMTRVTDTLKSEFSKKTQGQLSEFYIRFENYAAATRLLESKPEKEPADFFALLELYYRQGNPEKAEDLVDSLLQGNGESPSLLNRLGHFFLKKLYRPELALKYFKRSILIRPRQPQVREMIEQLAIYPPG